MDRQEVIDYLRKSLDKNLEELMRKRLNSMTYFDTYNIRNDVKEFEEVMEYIYKNLKAPCKHENLYKNLVTLDHVLTVKVCKDCKSIVLGESRPIMEDLK